MLNGNANAESKWGTALIVMAVAILGLGAYTVAYLVLCETFGSSTFDVVPSASKEVQITLQGQPFLDRMYPNQALANVFTPAALLETWLTGVQVKALNRATIDFDFTIDDTFPPTPP